MIEAWIKGSLVLIPEIVAPVVVPIALLFTKWEDEYLPRIFRWWDNDVSINGDRGDWAIDPATGKGVLQPQSLDKNDPRAIAFCYYAEGHHPRSFWARYVWLGWRNRASRLAQDLGYKYTEENQKDREYWGDPATGRDHEGTVVYRCGRAYQFYSVKKVGSKLCTRINYGFKVWQKPVEDGKTTAMVVNITFSLISWKG